MDQVSSESTVNVSIGQMLDRSQIETATNQIQNEMQEVQNINSQLQKDGHGEVSHERMIKDLEQKINEAKATFEEIEKTHTKGKNQLEKIQGAYNQKVEEKNDLEKKLKELMDKETPETKKILEKLQSLLSLSMTLKEQGGLFKNNCQNQLAHWTEQVKHVTALKPEDGGKGDKVLEMYDENQKKLEFLDDKLKKRNRKVSTLKRKIDQVPPRREIQQYTRQYIEIFEQLAVKYTETKSYYNIYNSLVILRDGIDNEIKLLESIQTRYPNAKKNKSGKESFVASLKQIITNLDDKFQKANDALEREKKKRDTLDEKYISLLSKERDYYRCAKEFQDECNKTEQLQLRLKKKLKEKK